MVGECFARTHRASASSYGVFLGTKWLDEPRSSVDDMGKDMKALTNGLVMIGLVGLLRWCLRDR